MTAELIVLISLIISLAGLLVFLLYRNSKLGREVSSKNTSLNFLQGEKIALQGEKLALEAKLLSLGNELKLLSENFIVLEQEKIYLEREKLNLKEQAQENSERMQKDFELLSNRIFNEAKTKFTEENQDRISTLLKPFKGDLKEFSLKLERMTESNTEKHASLSEQIKYLGELNKQVSGDANMLAKALKGSNKTAGDWGEMILEKMLESCGFLEGEHFFKQNSLKNDSGDNLRPDVLLKLPKERVIVIDSKVSLVDYLKYANDEVPQDTALKAIKLSLTNHIKGLSEKKYEDLEGIKTPEFVLIFIPIEGVFSLITTKLPELFELAYANKIVLASPSTLLSALKTIEFLWRVDKQEKNSMEIARLGGLLHDRIASFLKKFQELRQSINTLQTKYDYIDNLLSGSNQDIIGTARRLEALGAKIKAKIQIDTDL
ncbi:MAG: DNA recombination protein RmuC [Opitutales bacterium]